MSMTRQVNITNDMSSIIEAVKKYGVSNISLISRECGIPIETVRYRLNNQIPSLGLTFHFRFNLGRLGLKGFHARLQFKPEAEKFADSILREMHEVCFLTYHARELTGAGYATRFAVPFNLVPEWEGYMEGLRNAGILDSYSTKKIDWRRLLSFQPSYFDFHNEEWVIDWEQVKKNSLMAAPPQQPMEFTPSDGSINVDWTDLAIIKELQKDALSQLSEISRSIHVNEKTVGYHFRKHVKKLDCQICVRWLAGSSPQEKRKVALILFEFSELTKQQIAHCRAVFNNFPFAWSESGNDDDGLYLAEALIPLLQLPQSMSYIRRELFEEYSSSTVAYLDPSSDMAYTIPYFNFSKEECGWFFNREKARQAILKFIPTLEASQR
jgi:hypothetical protein